MNLYAVILQRSVLDATLPLWLVILGFGLACFGIVAILKWSELGESLRRWWQHLGFRRVVVTATLVLLFTTVSVYAVQFTPYYPCTAENWAWLEDNMHILLAYTVWYGAYGCF